jgi:outer membrane protein TolC
MVRTRITILIFITILYPVVSSGQDTLKFSVAEAQAYAVRNNRTVKSSRVDIELANKKIWENLAEGFPQINLNANYLHQFVVPEISIGPYLDKNLLPDGPLTKQNFVDAYKDSPPIPLGVMDNAVVDLTLSQLIFSGQYFTGLRATKVVQQVSEKVLVKAEDQAKESVADAYYTVLVLRENIRVLKESEKSLDNTYNELVKMNEQGLNEETDVDQMKINRSNITTMVTSLESQEVISLKHLKYLLGLGFDQQVELSDSLPGVMQEGSAWYKSLPEFRIENSIDYQIMDDQKRISEILVKLEKSKSLPTVSAFYRHEEQTNQPSFNFAVKDVVGATLVLPIFSSGMRSARVSQAKFEFDKAKLNILDTEQGLTLEFETARKDFQTAYDNYITNKGSLALSKKVYERTVIKYREGIASSLDLAQSQNQFLTAEAGYYNSLLSLLSSKARLDRILRTT